MTIDEMNRIKNEMGYSVRKLAQLSGVPFGTVQKVLSGKTKNPRYETIQKLSQALSVLMDSGSSGSAALQADTGTDQDGTDHRQVDNPYGNKMQGEYTVEDYLALPDDKRFELIDGVLFEMYSPIQIHQFLTGFLFYKLMECVQQHETPCMPYISPLDVQLDKDN